ncbi:MAG TPA: hypothetical protein DCF68_09565, partial [Cyanothece sp. UBA12306]|nr:hypothetical protein [Cyanothece sp. UBA12306]
MANLEHLTRLKQGKRQWLAWRDDNAHISPDLREIDLSGQNLERSYLVGVNLSQSYLEAIKLGYANLERAELANTNLIKADLS